MDSDSVIFRWGSGGLYLNEIVSCGGINCVTGEISVGVDAWEGGYCKTLIAGGR